MSNDNMSYEEVCQKQISDLETENDQMSAENNRLLQIQGWLKARGDELERIVSAYKAINTIDKHLMELGYKREG